MTIQVLTERGKLCTFNYGVPVADPSLHVGDQRTPNGNLLHTFAAPNMYGVKGYVFKLQADVLDAYISACEEAIACGYAVILVDAYRTYQQQRNRQRQRPDLATSPQKSDHVKGIAVDVRLYDPSVAAVWDASKPATWGADDILLDIMRLEGFERTVRGEPWHYAFLGDLTTT